MSTKIKVVNFIAAILLTLSCSSNHCKSTVCPENFTCEDGQCVCDEYHTGNNCEIEIRETFYGTFLFMRVLKVANFREIITNL